MNAAATVSDTPSLQELLASIRSRLATPPEQRAVPTADSIALAVVEGCWATGEDPLTMYEGQPLIGCVGAFHALRRWYPGFPVERLRVLLNLEPAATREPHF